MEAAAAPLPPQRPPTAPNHRLQRGGALPEAAKAVPARAGCRAGRQYVRSAPIGSRPGRAAGACAVGAVVRRCDAREHGGGGAEGVAAAAAGRGGGWRPVAVGAVLLAGPVALRPLRPGALRGHLPAALRAPGPGQPALGGAGFHPPVRRGGAVLRWGTGSRREKRGVGLPGGEGRREGSSCLAAVPVGEPCGQAWGKGPLLAGERAPGSSSGFPCLERPSLKRKVWKAQTPSKKRKANSKQPAAWFIFSPWTTTTKYIVSVLGLESMLDAFVGFAVIFQGLQK